MTREDMLERFSTVAVGDTCHIEDCCREVRLGATPCHVGKLLDGFNTLSGEWELWGVVEVDERDQRRSLVQRLR
jgi:hypothetical protein